MWNPLRESTPPSLQPNEVHDLDERSTFSLEKYKLSIDSTVPTRLKFEFFCQTTPILGRDAARNDLLKFCERHEAFVWWQISGSPGQGKRRLALDLANRLNEKGWNAGFQTSHPSSFNLEHGGEISENTLIIIEKPRHLSRLRDLGQLICRLDDQVKQTPGVKIRLLIVDAVPYVLDDEGEVASELLLHRQIFYGSDAEELRCRSTIHATSALHLEQLTAPELESIAGSWAREAHERVLTSKEYSYIRQTLGIAGREVPGAAREWSLARTPLGSILAAEHICEQTSTNKKGLSLSLLLDSLRKQLIEGGRNPTRIDQVTNDVIHLSNMCGGIARSEIPKRYFDSGIQLDLVAEVTESKSELNIEQIQPDLLGGYHFIASYAGAIQARQETETST